MKLNDEITDHFRLVETQKKALKRLNLITIEQLLYHFPTRYDEIKDTRTITSLNKGDTAVVYGKVQNLKTKKAWKRKTPMTEGTIEDATGKIKLMWFHQPYIAKMIQNGSTVKLSGTVTGNDNSLYIANPKIEESGSLHTDDSLFADGRGSTFPIYPESRGITSLWFYHALQRIFNAGLLEETVDPIPENILKKYNLPALKSALIWIHTPKKEKHARSARKRFAFEEVFYIQLAQQKRKREYKEKEAFIINSDPKKLQSFIDRFPFSLTKSQEKAINDITEDFKKGYPMSRLLEGDVGSGKTAVAAATIYAVTVTNPKNQDFGTLQTGYMVPTEILAKQHFESFIEYFSHMPIRIGLITSSGCKKFPSKVDKTKATDISRAQLLKWVKNGEISILIGTHSLIQKSVEFENLAYVIIDEQHRFGTMQRKMLTRKDNIMPHLLSMTATPIPRTLALTIYGDLDLTLLDEMPIGRKPIITDIVMPDNRNSTYSNIKKELESGRQLYVICPRIDEPDPKKSMALNVKSVMKESEDLKKNIFQDYEIDILHSKMKPKEKEEVMKEFEDGNTQILVATSVVEVGVNVPNATTIIIEGAERFGLAQLHQLRGRVIRSNHQAYCHIFAETKSQKTKDRLKALKTAKNGFELAEHDLNLRGAGELYGRHQSGISDIAMEAIKNPKMVEAARNEAKTLSPKIQNYPLLERKSREKEIELHFE